MKNQSYVCMSHIRWAIALMIIMGFVPLLNVLQAQSYSGGSGTQANPYQISNRNDMDYLSSRVRSGYTYSGNYFCMTNDIDMGSIAFTPIGSYLSYPFRGNFNGNGYTINNLNISGQALFPYTIGANISYLTIGSGSKINNSSYATGAFIGYMNGGSLTYCVNYAHVSGTGDVGGLVGASLSSFTTISIINCANKGNVTCLGGSTYIAGGIIGRVESANSEIKKCYNRGNVSVTSGSNSNRAGIVGGVSAASSASPVKILNCYNTGVVNYGIVSFLTNGSCTNTYYLQTAVASSNGVGISQTAVNMQNNTFVTMLNASQDPIAFYQDETPQINNGYPLLNTEKLCRVTYNSNGGIGTMLNQVTVPRVSLILIQNNFTNPTAFFKNWNTEVDGTGASYNNETSITSTSDITLYAQWETAAVVTFDPNMDGKPVMGTMSPQKLRKDTATNLTNCQYTLYAHTFGGWNTQADGLETLYTNGQSVTLSTDLKLYAQWQQQSNAHQVIYNGDLKENTIPFDKTYFLTSSTFTLPVLSVSNFRFDGWFKDEALTDGPHLTISANSATTDQLFWTKWSPMYTLTFDANGLTGTVHPVSKQVVNDGVSTYGNLATIDPLPIGYTFLWNTQSDGNGMAIKATDVVTMTAHTTLYAQLSNDIDWIFITTRNDLENLATYVNAGNSTAGKYYFLDKDIDMGGTPFTPIGDWSNAFSGLFYGNGHKITNLNVNSTMGGLFGQIMDAQIQFLIIGSAVDNSTVMGTAYTGALVALMRGGTITNCLNYASVTSTSGDIGGLVGYAEGACTFSNSANKGTIVSNTTATNPAYYAGGIVGNIANGTGNIINCYNNAAISGANSVGGGIAGYAGGNMRINNCYNAGAITTAPNALGITNTWGSVQGTNNYYLRNSSDWGFGTYRTQMQNNVAFVTTMNNNQSPAIFYYDAANQNDGYPILNLLNTHRIAFNGNGGDGYMFDVVVSKGLPVSLTPNQFTDPMAFFKNWNTEVDGTGTEYDNTSTFTPEGDMTLYAQWEPVAVITFNTNGGTEYVTGNMSPQKVHLSEATPLNRNQFIIYGYKFSNWAVNANGTGQTYDDGANITLTDHISLYAQWLPKNRASITYHNLKQAIIADSLHYYFPGDPFTLPIPITPGYNFAGWYDNPDLSGFKITTIPATENTAQMFYADWTPQDNILKVTISSENIIYQDINTLIPPNEMIWDLNPMVDFVNRTIQFFLNFTDLYTQKDRTLTIEIPNGYKLLAYSAMSETEPIPGLQKINMSLVDEAKTTSVEVIPYTFPHTGNTYGTTWDNQKISGFTQRNSDVESDIPLYCGEIKYTFNETCDFITVRIQLGIQDDYFPHNTTPQVNTLKALSVSGSENLTQELKTSFTNVIVPTFYTNFNTSNTTDPKRVSKTAFTIENALDVYSSAAGIQEHYADSMVYVITYPASCTFKGFTERFLTYDFQPGRYHNWEDAQDNVLEIKNSTGTHVHLRVTNNPTAHTVTFEYSKMYVLRAEGVFQWTTNWSTNADINTTLNFPAAMKILYHNHKWTPLQEIISYVKVMPDEIAFYAQGCNITRLDLDADSENPYPYDYALGKFNFFNNGNIPPTDILYKWNFGPDLRVCAVSFPATEDQVSNHITDVVATVTDGTNTRTIQSDKIYQLRYRNNNIYGIYVTADSLELNSNEYIISLEAKQTSVYLGNRYDFPYTYSAGVYYGKFNNIGGDHSASLTLVISGNLNGDEQTFIDNTTMINNITNNMTQRFGAGETHLYNTNQNGNETNNYYYGDVIQFTAVNNAEQGYIIQDENNLIVQNEVFNPTIVIALPEGLNLDINSVKAKSPSGNLNGAEFALEQQGDSEIKTIGGVPWTIYRFQAPSIYDMVGRALNTLQPDVRDPLSGSLISVNSAGADTVRFEVEVLAATYAYPNLKMQDLVFWDFGMNAINATGGISYVVTDVNNVLGKGTSFNIAAATQDPEIAILLLPVLEMHEGIRTYKGTSNSAPFIAYDGNNVSLADITPLHNAEVCMNYINNSGGIFYPGTEIYLPIPKKGQNFTYYFQNMNLEDPFKDLDNNDTFKYSMTLRSPIPTPLGIFKTEYGVGVRTNSIQPKHPGGADNYAWKPVEIAPGNTNGIENKWYSFAKVDVDNLTNPAAKAEARAILNEVNMVRFVALQNVNPGIMSQTFYQLFIDQNETMGLQNHWRLMNKGWVDEFGTGSWQLAEIIGAQTAKAGVEGLVFIDTIPSGESINGISYQNDNVSIELVGKNESGDTILKVALPVNQTTGRFSYSQPMLKGTYTLTIHNGAITETPNLIFSFITSPVHSYYTQNVDGRYNFIFNNDLQQNSIIDNQTKAIYTLPVTVSPEVVGIGLFPTVFYNIYYHNTKCADLTYLPKQYNTTDPEIRINEIECFSWLFNGWFTDSTYTTPSNIIPAGSTGDKHFWALWTKDCPTEKYDEVNETLYTVVSLAGRCWYRENVKATKYQNGTDIPFAKGYECPICPPEAENITNFGRIYTWSSAVGTIATEKICPEGWYIPTVADWNLLNAYSAEELRDTQFWLSPNTNNNSTTFTSRPAGIYNGALNRFEKLYGYTAYWALDGGNGGAGAETASSLQYNCDQLETIETRKGDGISVRCIME